MLRVSVESGSDSGEDYLFYEVIRRADDSEGVEIRLSHDLDDDANELFAVAQRQVMLRALSIYATAEDNLRAGNAALLAGDPPDDEKFALKYWRKQGYLKARLPG